MGLGVELRDRFGMGGYITERILPLAPREEPLPFRGRIDGAEEPLPFFDEMEADLRARNGAFWSVVGPSGSGKTLLARWAAARWGRRFLDDPDGSPAVLWMDALDLRRVLENLPKDTTTPPAYSLSSAIPGAPPMAVAHALKHHACIAILDKDEDPALEACRFVLSSQVIGKLRFLHFALKDSLPGRSVEMGLWDRDDALLAGHKKRGSGGVRLIEAVASSPFAALVKYPPFVAWLLSEPGMDVQRASIGGAIFDFLRAFHLDHPGRSPTFAGWCRWLHEAEPADLKFQSIARKLHLGGSPGADLEVGRILRLFLLAETLKEGRMEVLMRLPHFVAEDLRLLRHVLWPPTVIEGALQGASSWPLSQPNLIHLHWWVLRKPLPRRTQIQGGQIRLPGHPFAAGLVRAMLQDSDLSGISLGEPIVRHCAFLRCDLRGANLAGAEVKGCAIVGTNLELADLSGCTFETCDIRETSLAEAVLTGASFRTTGFDGVTFGGGVRESPLGFLKCHFRSCDLSRLAESGFYIRECDFWRTSFAGLRPRSFDAERAEFSECDFTGFTAPESMLARATFKKCSFGDVCLRGADLTRAKFIRADFQPGPGSRSGLTDPATRVDALHGSKSGFYAEDLADGVYLDPEQVRTADLRGADLRGAAFTDTDLFRVDLRGARMDPALKEMARRMRAFIDP